MVAGRGGQRGGEVEWAAWGESWRAAVTGGGTFRLGIHLPFSGRCCISGGVNRAGVWVCTGWEGRKSDDDSSGNGQRQEQVWCSRLDLDPGGRCTLLHLPCPHPNESSATPTPPSPPICPRLGYDSHPVPQLNYHSGPSESSVAVPPSPVVVRRVYELRPSPDCHEAPTSAVLTSPRTLHRTLKLPRRWFRWHVLQGEFCVSRGWRGHSRGRGSLCERHAINAD